MIIADRMPWMEHANCRDCDPDLFFPEKGPGCHDDVAAAKAVCQGCVVRTQCLDYAIDLGEKHGVWGGRTEKERRAIRRQRIRGAAA